MDAEQQTAQTPSTQAEETAELTTLMRKAHVGKEEHQARAMTLAKALRLTAAKVADDLFDMALAVIGLRGEQRALETLSPIFDAQHLLMLLEGPGRSRAAAVMDAPLVGALIQQQTMGKVAAEVEGAPTRPLTDTDAAICAPFLDALLSRAAPIPEDADQRSLIEGYSFGARTAEPRLLLMALDAQSYRVLYLTIDIEGGRRQGTLTLCLPEGDAPSPMGTVSGAADASWGGSSVIEDRTLTEPVMALNVALPVALTRLQLPLARLSSLKVGDALALNDADFGRTRILTPQGKTLGRGLLGQVSGTRALRLDGAGVRRADVDGQFDHGGTGKVPLTALPSLDLGQVQDASTPTAPVEIPSMTDEPDAPDLPDLGDLPDMSDLPELDNLPSLPDLPDLPDMSDLPDLDDLAPLPELDIS